MGRPSLGERTRHVFRLPQTVEQRLEATATATGLDHNTLAVLFLCRSLGVEIPREYAKHNSRFEATFDEDLVSA